MRHTVRMLLAVAFVMLLGMGTSHADEPASRNIRRRGELFNSRIVFEAKKTGHVAFMGGSITAMNGYRPMVTAFLAKRFPQTKFTFTDAGISSTCSTSGAFRLKRDVLSKGPVDLFFVEFAVNDDQDAGHARRECIRGMEGVVRQIRRHNPRADIVITHFVNPSMLETVQQGGTPLTVAAHETVAERYAVSTIDLTREVADRIKAGSLTWAKYGGTHPKPFGNAIAASLIERLLTDVWAGPLTVDGLKLHPTPKGPVDPLHYGQGRFLDPKVVTVVKDWERRVPDWKNIPGGKRSQFTSIPIFVATKPGAELSLSFEGTAVGAFVVAGPDAGRLEAAVDGGEFRTVDLYHRFSAGLHYPRTVMLATDLKPGQHTLRVRLSEKKNGKSKGTAARVMQFTAN
jgi:lysophospholipase L1-like esterase